MLRYGFAFSLIAFLLMACAAPAPTPTIVVAVPGATATEIQINTPVVVSTLPLPQPSDTALPTITPPPSETALSTLQPTLVSSNSPTATLTVSPSVTATGSLSGTNVISPTNVISASPTISFTEGISSTVGISVTAVPTVHVTPRPRPTTAPAGPAILTQLFSGQRVTAMYVSGDGTIYYGVAPSDESLQFPAQTVFQLWKWSPGSSPIAISPATMHLIGGVLVHNGMIYFNEQGALRRRPDDNKAEEGEVVIRYPEYLGNKNLPYGHMNHALANYTLNGQPVMLMAMGSVLDSSFPGAGVPANIAPPFYEHFPTGRINYATFDWLDNTHDFTANDGVAGQFDEFARGVRNPWSMTVGVINGQTHIFAVDNDPAFTPEKSDNIPNNAGDEVNDIVLGGNYGHPYAYGMASNIQPIVVFPDGSVPSGVAVAAGKLFVSLQNAAMIVKVDLAKRTYTPVLTNISPFNLYAVGNLLYVADFDGIHVIDARGL